MHHYFQELHYGMKLVRAKLVDKLAPSCVSVSQGRGRNCGGGQRSYFPLEDGGNGLKGPVFIVGNGEVGVVGMLPITECGAR